MDIISIWRCKSHIRGRLGRHPITPYNSISKNFSFPPQPHCGSKLQFSSQFASSYNPNTYLIVWHKLSIVPPLQER